MSDSFEDLAAKVAGLSPDERKAFVSNMLTSEDGRPERVLFFVQLAKQMMAVHTRGHVIFSGEQFALALVPCMPLTTLEALVEGVLTDCLPLSKWYAIDPVELLGTCERCGKNLLLETDGTVVRPKQFCSFPKS